MTQLTLAVSLRVPDGVVAAVDSLASTIQHLQLQISQIQTECPECRKPITLPGLPGPAVDIPSSTSDTALKMYGFEQYAVAYYGAQFVNGRTVYRQIRDFHASRQTAFPTAKALGEALSSHLQAEWEAQPKDTPIPLEATYFGLQISGFDDKKEVAGHTYVVFIAKEPKFEHYEGFGCTVSGDRQVVTKLWREEPDVPTVQPPWNMMTLQDAIDYADFLIRTTAEYQRFAQMIPRVGGPVDIALVTQYGRGFQWIRRKPMSALLEEDYDHPANRSRRLISQPRNREQ